ncbi:Chromatin modification-related protein EAF1 B, partial [Mucuna pruriens]
MDNLLMRLKGLEGFGIEYLGTDSGLASHELPQIIQGTSQGIPAFSGMSSTFNNQITPPVQSYPGYAQQPHQLSEQLSHLSNPYPLQDLNHATNSPKTYATRLAKERSR